jgi:competence protein ComEA
MNRQKLIHVVKEYFTFTTSERNGILVLLFLIILTAAIKRIVITRQSQNKPTKEEIFAFKKETARIKEDNNKKAIYFKRDSFVKKQYYNKKSAIKIREVDINHADSADFEKLPGLGPYLSGRIIKYRHSLGGFCSIDQLMEVYGIHEENYNQSKPYLKIDTSQLIKININRAVFKEINAHPYITYEQTVAIFKLRNKGININPTALLQYNIFDTVQFKKIIKYLTF